MGQLGAPVPTPLTTGVTVPVLSQGDPNGPVLLLLHAWAESARVFDRLAPRLPTSVHAVAFDQRGHGDASAPRRGYRLADYAADVVALLDALRLEHAVLLGSSSGGYVAQEVARRHPGRVAGLVLAGAPHDLTRPPAFAEEVLALEDPVERDWAQASLTWFPLFTSVPEWYVRARLDEMVRVPAVVLREAFRGLLEARPPTRDGPLGVPGLVVWGERDTVLDRAGQEALASALDGGELVVYPRTGHLLLWEQPEQLAGDAVRFVAGLAHGSAPGHRARP